MRGISEKQAIILFAIIIIATKFQRFPSLVAQLFGRDGWLVVLAVGVIELLFLLLLLGSFSRLNKKTIFETFKDRFGLGGQIFVGIVLFVYFYFMCILTYKSNHEFFAKTLFDKLPWEFYSIILIMFLFVMVKCGINSISRTSELLSWVIGFGLFFALLLGVVEAKFERLMPILDVDIKEFGENLLKIVPWFGDFMYLIPMFGLIQVKEENEKRFKKSLVWTYVVGTMVVSLFYVVFYCLNGNLSVFQSSGISSITVYTLIGLGIGRPDWFLVLFAFLATILCTAYTSWVLIVSLSKIFNVKVNVLMIVIGLCLIYVGDVFVLTTIEVAVDFYQNFVSIFAIAVNIVLPVLCVIACRRRNAND